jgi:fatty-acyl-CoA synthase
LRTPLTVGGHLERAALVYGTRTGVVDEPDAPGGGLGSITYARMGQLARAQAAGLDGRRIGRGERVAILSQNAARLLTSFFGVSGYGRVLVPINFRLSRAEIAYILEHSGASMLLVDPELADLVADISVEHRLVLGTDTDSQLYVEDREPQVWKEQDEDATATINYTSGTTARPKGVELTHRNLWLNSTIFGWHAGITDRDVYLHTLPMFHCNGWGMPFALAAMGVPQVVLRRVDGTEVLNRIEEHGVTLLCGAPAVLSAILEAGTSWSGPIPGRHRVRVVVAGAPPPSLLIERVETELEWEFLQIYGLTETAPLLTVNRSRQEWDELEPEERAKRLSRAGPPAVGVTVSVDRDGEVLARANHVMKSYWDQPEDTAVALADGWFHTGDGGTIDSCGYLTISDRKKDVIITGGENVSSIEVEDKLFSHPSVAEVAVIGVPSQQWGETIKALVVLVPDGNATEDELQAWCKERLAGYKCPTSVEFRESLARTATGKLQKFKLRAPYWDGYERKVN